MHRVFIMLYFVFIFPADGSSVTQYDYSRNSVKFSKEKFKMFSNDSAFKNFKNLTISDYVLSTIILSQSKIISVTDSTFSTGSSEHEGDKDVNNALDSNDIIIIILSLNTAMILIVCCIIGICVYYKRKLISSKTFEVKDVNEYNRNRSCAKRIFSQDVLLHKQHDFDLKMTDSLGNSQRCFTNAIEVPCLVQESHLQSDVYENESQPYLNRETSEIEAEYHQYLTVV